MNSADPHHPWQRLTAAARRAPAERESAAPYGFSTRVAALALGTEQVSLFARFAPRALGLSCLLALASVAVNYSALTSTHAEEDTALFSSDPVAALLDPS